MQELYPRQDNMQYSNYYESIFGIGNFDQTNCISQEERLEKLESTISNLNRRMTDWEQTNYYNIKDIKASEVIMKSDEQTKLTNDIIKNIEELSENEEIRDQIATCASMAKKTLKLLKITSCSSDGNYRKSMLHLFYQVIKRNYARELFNEKQISLLKEMLMESKKPFISEDRYAEFDEQLYLNKLTVFPEEE